MVSIDKLLVSIYLGDEIIEVGELVSSNRRIHFKYHSLFLEKGINISPIKLPLTKGIHTAEAVPFNGLFGVFNDSLPDGWGRLLLDRKLIAQGISLNNVSPLDRLAYVGKKGK
jgi:serine/threonine-protein kinase HipA